MKALNIDYEYYLYPENTSSIEDFMDYIDKSENKFIPLMQLYEDNNCIAPYFIDEDKERYYLNVDTINKFHETEITLLSKAEYDSRLAELVSIICVDCINYEEDKKGENLNNFRDKLRLDGYCYAKETEDDEEDED